MTQLVGLCIDLFIHYYYRFKAGFFLLFILDINSNQVIFYKEIKRKIWCCLQNH